MADLKDNQMPRGLGQALYKYLPDCWIDFYIKSTRTVYTAKVMHWNSTKLSGINEKRLLKAVSQAVNAFKDLGGRIKNFGPDIDINKYDILTPKCGVNSDIFAEVNPRTFYCSNPNCKKIHYFKSSGSFLSNPQNRYCKECKSMLRQVSLVYACECGWAEPVAPIYCTKNKEHGMKHLKLASSFKYICSKCGDSIQMLRRCPECGKTVPPRNALDQSQFIPFSLTMIDLVKSEKERFVSDEKLGSKLIIAYWLGKITNNELQGFIKNGIRTITEEERAQQIQERIAQLLALGIPTAYAEQAATVSVDNENNNVRVNELIKIVDQISGLTEADINNIAIKILEYDTILNSKEVSTLDDAIVMARKLNTNANPEIFKSIASRFKFNHAQVSGGVPFVTAAYGYTRRESEPSASVCLNAFPQETNEKKNIYASRLETEGVLFEIDRKKIIEWLLKNGFIIPENVPGDLDDETELKIWFLENIHLDAIKPFSEIDTTNPRYQVTSHVYNLIHSISHALIRQAAQLCGLDKNSLSEYIFPNIPAIFIYCQNSQGFSLGALFNIFEAYFDRWMTSMLSETSKCVFDPICIDRDKACSGCIYLNEISCTHFNKDLNRRYLLGWFDKVHKSRTFGFWED